MDVEGTDGREKEDQKAFEGKSALFSLALTDVMMVNMWMHEVGRFNAANLPLLKTVFEVGSAPTPPFPQHPRRVRRRHAPWF